MEQMLDAKILVACQHVCAHLSSFCLQSMPRRYEVFDYLR